MAKYFLLFLVITLSVFLMSQCATTGSGRSSQEIVISTTPDDEFQVDLRLTRSNFDYLMVRPDGNNIRFFDTDGNALAYWIQQWNPKAVSVIWVRVKNAGTDRLVIKPAEQDAPAQSSGESVFDRVDWDSFRKSWLFSGMQSGRVAGWEDPLADYRLDTGKWTTCDIAGKYAGSTDYSRWFVRKEFFISKGTIGFSGNTNNAEVWTLIGSDELYEKIAGDERDIDGNVKGKYSHSFALAGDFGRYVWAGRGQIRTGEGELSILSIDAGMGNIYTRKIATAQVATRKGRETALPYADSIFPGDPKSLPEKSITRGWRAWPGAENLFIAKEGALPVLVSPVLGEKQKLVFPTGPFADNFECTIKVGFLTPKSFDTLLDVSMGTLAFGIFHEKSNDSYSGYVNKTRNWIGAMKKDTPVTLNLEKEGTHVVLFINGNKSIETTQVDNAEFRKSTGIVISAMNPKIYDFSITVPTENNPMVTHNVFFREDFSGMREGAVFYGWKGIEDFKIVNDAGRIALVSIADDEEEQLDISELPFPEDFRLGIDVGLPLARETKFSMRVWTGTVNFGIRSDKGKYLLAFGSQEKAVNAAQPGKRVSFAFYKQGSRFGLSVDDEKVFDNLEIADFVIGRTISIKSINPRLYEVFIENISSTSTNALSATPVNKTLLQKVCGPDAFAGESYKTSTPLFKSPDKGYTSGWITADPSDIKLPDGKIKTISTRYVLIVENVAEVKILNVAVGATHSNTWGCWYRSDLSSQASKDAKLEFEKMTKPAAFYRLTSAGLEEIKP